ncbi:glycogen/starch/alpha-glucan phosphorylase [Companilactobacillus nodensis]|uniref:Alpha-1,4 glucan phosphorylase n=1 Tax=Companilactobacillus nodensis DSM 19682 = JCM 14932 = NBRC 107160 TaxID=1423775 RepID=A0A0R1KMC4_9LACO|nr:glycogen/starch/alpha-glucan phosphorylase [Companilactobacillus nodensis]KRK81226.1 glycogen phosphorylase [Companilactobacillus nodensis DSM 19682 = JCM 14932 = NBRC 107160]
MKLDETKFTMDFINEVKATYAIDVKDSSPLEQLMALGNLIKRYDSSNWKNTSKNYRQKDAKQVYYFSIEFLPGRLMKSNLLNLGILDTVRDGLDKLGLDFEKICSSEPDPGLGNGGLGRLAACYMDSMASLGMAGNGNGIRYRYGLFKQVFMNGYQVELPDDWLRNGNVWEIRRENRACLVRFGGHVWLQKQADGHLRPVYDHTDDVLPVPYDVGIVGYHNDVTNTMRLWSAELPPSADQTFYNQAQRDRIDQITEVLYPDDSNAAGRSLRLRQEYFFSSAGVQSIVRHYFLDHLSVNEFARKVAIHINDTHPTLVIPELMRILLDEYDCPWDKAWQLTVATMSYTNHTIMQEALETWPIDMFKGMLPRIYEIVEEIDRRYREEKTPIFGENTVDKTAPLGNGQVRMAYLAVIGSHSVNGVAPLHTELLKKDVLQDLYRIYPERFNNKTNGIASRRWLQLANEPLSNLIDSKIGETWRYNPKQIQTLSAFKDDDDFLNKLEAVKIENKKQLAKYVDEELGIKIRTDAIYDVQIKRLHAYKRQLLHALEIIREYLDIKDHPKKDVIPRVHFFGAKAAPSYHYAKSVIKMINALAELVNNDKAVEDKLKVVFVPNYGVSLGELIIPAADISEQISTASKEASGTSNMKLMTNGALSLATMDGANIDIVQAAGKENEYTFGLTADDVYGYYHRGDYHAAQFYDSNPELQRILETFVDGTIPGISTEGREIYDSLLRYNDEYFVLADYAEYVQKQKQISQDFTDKKVWEQKSLANIAASGTFSADYAVARYGEDIWQVPYDRVLK